MTVPRLGERLKIPLLPYKVGKRSGTMDTTITFSKLGRSSLLEGKIIITKSFGLSQLIYFLQCCVMYPEDIIRVDRITFKFLWNKKWDGKCPDRIQRQVLKNNYEMGGLKAPDMEAFNSALKVKQFFNATKSKK